MSLRQECYSAIPMTYLWHELASGPKAIGSRPLP